MKVQTDGNINLSQVSLCETVNHKGMTNKLDRQKHLILHKPDFEIDGGARLNFVAPPGSPSAPNSDCGRTAGEFSNGETATSVLDLEGLDCNMVNGLEAEDGMAELSEDSSSAANDDDDVSYELQQAHRIFNGFLLEKHRGVTAPFMHSINTEETGEHIRQPMCFQRMEEKFQNREYESITEFVADFRLMLENCYRFYGVDHWISKQAQKLEIMLEQKLTLLSRTLREKTTLTITSKGRFGIEEEKGLGNTSTRRRSIPRNLTTIAAGGSESLMVQALRREEQQRAKEEKRLREQEKKEAEEASAKELEDWEHNLLAKAAQWPMGSLWELPAIGHFLCLAQTVLNLPEIVFFELERCLLMPRCSTFLAKVMTSLLCHPQRRATLHRRPPLTYRRWEAALRYKVLGWYEAMGQSEDTALCAEQLGLCPQFFRTLGETSPLEEKPFHQVPFNQRVWLLKGLCDFVYENQKEVQDAVLSQPIHECRESILGYDGHENAYIHFPHFCGADLRIYCQSPSTPPEFPLPPIQVKKLERPKAAEGTVEAKEPLVLTETEKNVSNKEGHRCDLQLKDEDSSTQNNTMNSQGLTEDLFNYNLGVQINAESGQKLHANMLPVYKQDTESLHSEGVKTEPMDTEHRPEMGKEGCPSVVNTRTCESFVQVNNIQRVCQKSTSPGKPPLSPDARCTQGSKRLAGLQDQCPECSANKGAKEEYHHCCNVNMAATTACPERPHHESAGEGKNSRMRTKKKKRKKKKIKVGKTEGQSSAVGSRLSLGKTAKIAIHKSSSAQKKKDKRKKLKSGKKLDSKKLAAKKNEPATKLPTEPKFQLVCSSVDELRELISKTEDELEELENTRKKSGKWSVRRQSVKELHITLIRLLKELSPWESKIVKAFQRNRARLKKDYDDFKKHPDYDNFVREEWVEENRGRRDSHSLDNVTASEKAEKQDQGVKADDTKQHVMESTRRCRTPRRESSASDEHRTPLKATKRALSGSFQEDLTWRKKIKIASDEQASSKTQAEVRESDAVPADLAEEVNRVMPMAVFQQGSKPIQALLAKSVGNKVTLISQPAAANIASRMKAESPVKSSRPLPNPGQPLFTPKSPVQSPVPVIYKTQETLDQLRKGASSRKVALQPVPEQQPGQKDAAQVIILPALKEPLHRNVLTSSKPCTSLASATGIAGGDGTSKVPIQQVAPLTAVCRKTPATTISISLPATSKSSYVNSNEIPNKNSVTNLTSNEPDSKQELRTVCIRDSQSILVTTRGGNTGVVKVQTSDQAVSGFLASSPIITISPQLQAFLVSKASPPAITASPAVPSSAIITAAATTSSTASLFNISLSSSVCRTSSTIPTPVSAGHKAGNSVNLPLSQTRDTIFAPITANKCNITTQPLIATSSGLPAVPQSSLPSNTVPVTSDVVITQTSSPFTAKTPPKTVHPTETLTEQPPLQRVIFVTPSSAISSVVTSKVPSTTASMSSSRLMFISQTPASVEQPSVSIPKKTVSSNSVAIPMTTASQITDMKVGHNLSQTIGITSASSMQKLPTVGLISGVSNKSPTEALNVTLPLGGLDSKSGSVARSNTSIAETTSGGKTFTFSPLKTGHLMTAGLSVTSQQQTTLSPSVGHLKTVQSESSSLKSVVPSSVMRLINKDLALIPKAPNGPPTSSPIFNKPQFQAQTTSKSLSLKMSPLNPTATSKSQTCGSSTPGKVLSTPAQAAQHSVNQPPVESTIQQKIVINTSTPLSPGSQIVINNTRFIVPPQGLGPGSHMLLISTPVVTVSSPQGVRPPPPSQPGAAAPGALPPALSTAKIPLNSVPSTQAPHMSYVSASTSTVKLGSLYPSSVPRMSSQSATKSTPLHVGFAGTLPREQLAPVMPVVSTIITRTQVLPTAAVPPVGTTVPRIQSVPVATVFPSAFSRGQASPIASAPPFNTAATIAAGHSVSIHPGQTNVSQTLNKPSVQATPPPVLSSASIGKLLVSPDGAVLNAIPSPIIPSLPPASKTLASVVVTPSSGTGKVLPLVKTDGCLPSVED